nr:inverse autotransporter beta domain-containing protein [Citrobacter sp. NCU1]
MGALGIALLSLISTAIASGGLVIKTQEASLQTQIYILSVGETVDSVAKKYNTTTEALRQLNQFRTFAHGFEYLQPGDELEVPLVLPTDITSEEKEYTASAENDPAKGMAEMATQAGSFLSGQPNTDAATSMAKGMVVGKANQTVQDWMNQFGTAQVSLTVDDDFSLKGSSLNILHPWYDSPKNMVFSQTGIHRTDDRTQMNIGIGWRHFRPVDMMGVNLFLDYDLSRDHARAGVGAEYWRDFLKLSANSYLGLTRWRESSDVEDYEERPASGWDVRAEAWLPAYPQLGANVVMEQYYGDEVGLFGKDDRQKNPHALTTGISYTPVPMLTLKADQRMGQGGKHDTEVKMEVNYHPGEPLANQLDAGAVAASRSLAGTRYDLIDRNNNIVLEYRKQEVIKLHAPERITGKAGQVMPLALTVKSKHGLKVIRWDDAAFIGAGGKLNGEGTQWQLTLPQWTAGAVNAWSIIGVAYDTKDNASKPAEIQVVLTAPVVYADNSTLIAQDVEIPADGKSQTHIVITLKDAVGNPVSGIADQITLSGAMTPDEKLMLTHNSSEPVIGALKETAFGSGIYTASLTSGMLPGAYTLTAKVLDVTLKPVTVQLDDTTPDFAHSELNADKTVLKADGIDTAKITLSLKHKMSDGSVQPYPGEISHLRFFVEGSAVDSSKFTFTEPEETVEGQYTVRFSGTQNTTTLSVGVRFDDKDTGLRYHIDLTTGMTVAIAGNSGVNGTLSAIVSCGTPCGVLAYQWQRETSPGSDSWSDITDATTETYIPQKEDQKKKIRLLVTE